jgi:thiamine biosynthesis lipoprotein
VGYALDRAASVLRARGVERAFIDVSGDCIALGAPPGEGWRVDLADPTGAGLPAAGVLRDCALATSANTMSVIRYGAVVRGHVMDPATGYPADRMVQVVSRLAAERADVLSTAMLVAGGRSRSGEVDRVIAQQRERGTGREK